VSGPRRGRLTNLQWGVVALVVIAVLTYFGFAKNNPFTHPFELKAVFETTSNLQLNSPVRIAGVEVGKVTKVEAAADESTASEVTMEIKDEALPLHEDAELKIRPRIFLEGNFFVDVKPGTPGAGTVDDGDTIAMSQTSAPVQLDQVLTTLQADAREDLQKLLQGYGKAIGGEPEPGEDADQDEDVQGETAGKALNDTLEYSADALRGTAITNDALLGTELHDLSKLIKGQQKVSSALASREAQLKDLVTNFNITTAALASEEGNLRSTIRLLPEVLEEANPALDRLNAAFPPTRAFAREILPGVRETPATIAASFPWIRQTRKLLSPAELQGLVRDLQPAVDDLALTTDATVRLLPQVDLANRCALEVILPTGDEVIQDGALTTGVPNYKEFFQTLVGLSGESQNFDGNGGYTRFQPGGGTQTVSTGQIPGVGQLFANAINAPLGTRPAFTGKRPPYRRDLACHRNQRPDLDSAKIGGGP
jgi:phospholipid/cholesterol/gamma-HCH transport system substrate-binding protein